MKDFLKHIPENILSLKTTQWGQSSKIISSHAKLIKMDSNENPFGSSPQVKTALINQLNNIGRYPDDKAAALRSAVANYVGVAAEQIIFGNGSSEILTLIGQLFLRPGSNLLITQHAFALYQAIGLRCGANVKAIPDQNFQQDLNGLLTAIDAKTSLIILANPNNPTGTWIDAKKLFAFIKQIPNDVVVVIDEAYYEYMTDADYQTAVQWLADYPNLIISRTFSKAFGLAGLRIGYAVASKIMIDLIERFRQNYNVNIFAFAAALAALEDQQHLANTLAANQHERGQLLEFFKQHNFPVLADSANFLTVHFGKNATRIAEQLLGHGVMVRSLVSYHMPEYLRISVGTLEENAYLIKKLENLLSS